MIFQFSDGEFSYPIATSLKMWKKVNSFIVINSILRHFRRNLNKHAPPPPPPLRIPPKNFLHAFFFNPPTRKLASRSLTYWVFFGNPNTMWTCTYPLGFAVPRSFSNQLSDGLQWILKHNYGIQHVISHPGRLIHC